MSRCPPYVAIAILAFALATPLAHAQVLGPNPTPAFGLAATPAAAEVFPGGQASFTITIANDALVARDAKMGAQLPPDWTYDFSRDPVPVAPASRNQTVLSVFVPEAAAPGNFIVFYEANDTLGGAARATVNVTVKARPTTTGTSTQPLGPPRVALSVTSASSGVTGETLQGSVTVRHDDPVRARLEVQLSASAPSGWHAYLNASDQNRVLYPEQTATLPVYVEIPPLARETTVNVTVLATVNGTQYHATWTVTGSPAPSGGEASANESTQTTPTPTTSTTPTRPRETSANLEILVDPLELYVESGGNATAAIKLTNTGGTALTVGVAASPLTDWRPFDFTTKQVSLEPGERKEVMMTVHAPEGVPAGGTADITITGVAGGLARNAKLVVHTTIPSTIREEANAASVETPVAPEGSGLPALGPAALVAVGLAAAGTSALVLVNRPLREKVLWGAAGLYTRLARPDVLGHEDREKLYHLVETQPGIHFHALQRDLAWNTGTLTYHLRVLERHGFVVSRRDGLYRRFYLSGAAPRKEVFENQGPTGLRADVMEAIRNTPGISQSDLALALSSNKQTVNYHVKALERAGTIRVEKRGRDTFLYPADAGAASGPDAARA